MAGYTAIFVSLQALLLLALRCVAAEDSPVITRIAEVSALSREQAAAALPVRIRGVITWSNTRGCFVDDGERGIWVDIDMGLSSAPGMAGPPPLAESDPGALVEFEGVTDPGGYAPIIVPTQLRRLGTGDLPPARRFAMERLLSGAEDCSRAELEGVIQEATEVKGTFHSQLMLAVEGQTCTVEVYHGSPFDASKLVDARVRVRGVLAARINLRREFAGLRLLLNSMQDVEILTPAPADPFLTQRVPLSQLLPFSPNELVSHRKVTQGTVTCVFPGKFFFLQMGTRGIRVDSTSTEAVKVGDQVEVAGFVNTARTLAGMQGALVRRLGPAPVPPVVAVTAEQLLHPPVRGEFGDAAEDWSGRLVQLQGRLRRVVPSEDGEPLTMIIESEGTVFSALISWPQSARLPATWAAGAEVQLTGTCEMDFAAQPIARGFLPITGFRLWLSAPQDVQVLRQTPWWTPQRQRVIFLSGGLLLVLALAWIGLLRRQVARRGALLAQEIAARSEAVLEFDTTLRERTRLANDLHDTVEQALTSLSLQIQAAELFHDSEPARSVHHLQLAQQYLDRSREDVHRTVWDLRAHGLDGRSLVEALQERAEAMLAGSRVGLQVTSDGAEFPLPDFIAGNMLLLAQEAITNAMKHASPNKLMALVTFHQNGVTLLVTDDGAGFDPARVPGHREGHFGLQGMRERVKRLGGSLRIVSAPGRGSRIEVAVPKQAFGMAATVA